MGCIRHGLDPHKETWMFFMGVNAWSSWKGPSRPQPDGLWPPNDASGQWIEASLRGALSPDRLSRPTRSDPSTNHVALGRVAGWVAHVQEQRRCQRPGWITSPSSNAPRCLPGRSLRQSGAVRCADPPDRRPESPRPKKRSGSTRKPLATCVWRSCGAPSKLVVATHAHANERACKGQGYP